MTISPETIVRLRAAAGPKGFTECPDEIAPHLLEWRGEYQGHTQLMVKPATTEEVSRILTICNETRTAIVPQGGNTGLVGGQIPLHGEVLLSTARMNRIREIDAEGMSVIADAGVVLANLQRAVENDGLYFPLSLASEGSCTVGGNLSTNAGGVSVLRYGGARELMLGLEVVLADGRVLDLLRTLRKDNTGYDLKQLFVGSEGTLGIITAVALKLFPLPEDRVTAFLAMADPCLAVNLLHGMQRATGNLVSAFELIPRIGLELVLAHIPQTSDPFLARSLWYVLLECTSGASGKLNGIVTEALSDASSCGAVDDAVIASNESQRQALWRLRESLSEAQKLEGPSIKHDVSVRISTIPSLLRRGIEAVERIVPDARPVPFGHLGDGNIHFNFSVPKGGNNRAFLANREGINRSIFEIVNELGGSISAEHGVGVTKREDIARTKSVAEMDLMRVLKRTLDPYNILNPGKVVRV